MKKFNVLERNGKYFISSGFSEREISKQEFEAVSKSLRKKENLAKFNQLRNNQIKNKVSEENLITYEEFEKGLEKQKNVQPRFNIDKRTAEELKKQEPEKYDF